MRVPRSVRLALVLAALLGAASPVWLARSARASGHWILEIEMSVSAGTTSQLFWSSELDFDEPRSVRMPAPVDRIQTVRFQLPSQDVQWLRFDPTDQPGEMLFRDARLLDEHGTVIHRYDATDFKPINQIASITRDDGTTRARTIDGGDDPSFLFSIGCLPASVTGPRLAFVTRTGVVVAAAGVAILLAACAIAIGRRLRASEALSDSISSWRTCLAGLVTLFAVVFAAKLLVIRAYPLTIPYLDQWDAEARALLIPFNACALSWEQMFRFHNEHRIVLTRLLSLMLLFVNGQWDPRLQQVVNAVVHSGTGVLLAAMFIAAGGRRAFVMLAPIALVFAAPFGWENTVMGFQSAFYFQLLFAILSIWLLITPRNRGEWLLGVACAFLGLGAAAGALLAPVAVIVVAALDLICDPKRVNRSSIAIVSTAAAVAAFGWWFSSPPLAHHAALRAASIGEFLTALGRNLAWPLVGRPFAAVLLWLPTSVLVVTRMVRREPLSTADRWTVGLAAWTVLQAAAIAYGRGRNGPGPASRYQDLVSMGFLANTAALLYALDLRVPAGAVRTRVALLTVAVWTVVGYVGVGRLVDGSIIELNRSTVRWGQETADLRRFVTSDDPNVLAARLPSELPHPSADVLIRVLRDPFIRTILPASIRPPIHLTPASSTVGFVEDGGAWGSFPSSGHENRFDSQLLPADSAGFLRFSVARDADHPGSTLFLKGARTGRETTVDRPGSTAAGWTDLTVRQPSEPYSVVARDSGDGSWIAFTEPVQVGSGSFVAEYLIARSATILFLSFAAAVWFVGRFTAA